jgi:CubicO group peptidase (beta-lactamase class C family)
MVVDGTADRRFAAVRDVFAEIMMGQRGTGGALAVWCDGRRVIDIWGGYADAERQQLWGRDSLVQPYSVCKPFVAVCLLKLVDDGRVDLDAPVQRYWPEFRAAATIRQLLSHQAGVVAIKEAVPTDIFYRWGDLCRLLAVQEPAWKPGEAHGEAALFYGHLVGEVVRRVDGRSVGRFLRDEVCGPLGLDFAVGLDPSQQARAVALTGLDEAFRSANMAGRPALYAQAIENPPGAQDAMVVNGVQWRAAEIPAVNGHGTARAMADFYQALSDGKVLGTGLLAEAVTAQCSGPDRVFGHDNTWGLGFGVDNDGYGMGGLGGSYAGTSTAGGCSLAFVTGSLGTHDRGTALENAFRDCIGLAPLDLTN